MKVFDCFGVVYKITNLIDGKIYIGRYKYGRYPTFNRYWGSNKHLKRAIELHGLMNFTKEILQKAYSNDDLNAFEIHWIAELHATDPAIGYNWNAGGDCGTTSKEVGIKISKTKKGNSPSKYKGVPRSEEVRRKISESHKKMAHIITPESRKKMIEGLQRKKEAGLLQHSEETRKKISQARREGILRRVEPLVVSEETRKKLSKAHKGKPGRRWSEEDKQKSSLSKRGKPWSIARRAAQERKTRSRVIDNNLVI